MRAVRLLCAASLVVVLLSPVQAQVSTYINRVDAPTASQGDAASIGIELLPSVGAKRVVLRYRSFGVTEYTEMEMLPAGRSYTVSLPPDVVQPPYLQYYFQLELTNGTTATYPETSAEINPLQLSVQQVDPKENELRFLSPEPGETVSAEDFVLALSLYYASPAVAPSKTRIFIDGTDISREAVLSDDVILWSPANSTLPLKLGARTVRVELRDTAGNVYFSKSRSFNLSTTAAIAEEEARFKANGDVRAEYRQEQTARAQTFARVDARANGSYSFLEFGTNLRLDNYESPSRQPQNRYSFFADAEYARIELGDVYPRFPSLMMVGKRVRGITGALKLGFFNLDISVGSTERKIDGRQDSLVTYADSDAVRNRPLNSLPVGTSYFDYEIFTAGTYTRDFFGVRPSFGSGEYFQLGFTVLKFKDEMSSVKYAVQPKENLVVGTDLALAFDDQRIRWETQVAVGMYNKDIRGGSFTDADYDSLAAQGTDVKDMGKIAEKFITVNENLDPLRPDGTGLPGIAMESFLTVNYFNNYIRTQFIRRGTAYKSLGNEFQQSDIQGFVISDNIRLFSNRLFASLSYETKSDNLSHSKEKSTIDYGTFLGALTFNPGAGYPTVQVGYALGSRANDQTVSSPDTNLATKRFSKSADDISKRYTLGTSYDLNIGMRNFITLSLNVVDRTDNTIYKRDQSSMFLAASVSSFFTSIPLQTTVSVLTSQTKSQRNPFDMSGADSLVSSTYAYTALSLGAQYRMLDENLRLMAQVTPTFGDLKRVVFRFGGDYTVQAHVFELSYDYFKNTNYSNDSIVSLVYRYNF